ncbi:MAG: hypothetical protein WC552_10210 [Candidatus Omnitrophota bacterium]
MKKKQLIDELIHIDRGISEVETELRAMEYCREHGLNHDDASDYSRAVIAVHRTTARGAGGASNGTQSVLHYSNHLDSDHSPCYNRDIREYLNSCRERLAGISDYSWLGDRLKDIGRAALQGLKDAGRAAWEEAKERAERVKNDPGVTRTRQKLIGRTIKNNTNETIAVTGESRSGQGELATYLAPGQDSGSILVDADAVYILPGQKYFKSIGDRTAGNIATSGFIKVKDGIGTAEVAVDKKALGIPVFYVNAWGTQYFTEAQGRNGFKWKTP